MRTERLLRADGIIYGNVRGYYEDKHTYTFVINRKDIVFPKARYKLNKIDTMIWITDEMRIHLERK